MMKNVVVRVLNEKFDVVKTFDGFDDWGYARWFAKHEAEWRGCPVEAAWTDGAGNEHVNVF